jgi:hypothetical protein
MIFLLATQKLYVSSKMGIRLALQVELLVMSNFTNQKEMAIKAFKAKFVQNQDMSSHKFIKFTMA